MQLVKYTVKGPLEDGQVGNHACHTSVIIWVLIYWSHVKAGCGGMSVILAPVVRWATGTSADPGGSWTS